LEHATDLANALLANNVDPNAFDKDGKSPLHVAIKKQNLSALEFASKRPEFNFNQKAIGQVKTLLQYAVKKSQVDCF
jgi:ankyrin repeat protein